MYPKEQVALLDQDGLEKAIIYPPLGLSWETEDVEDLELQAAYARAYNRWVVDFCAGSGRRLIPMAHISFGGGNEATRELEPAVQAGWKGASLVPLTPQQTARHHPE